MGINRRRFIHNSGMAAAGLGAAGMATTPSLGEAAAQTGGTPPITVTGYETILLDNIDPPIGHRKWLFIKLFTNQGIVGLGERTTGGAARVRM